MTKSKSAPRMVSNPEIPSEPRAASRPEQLSEPHYGSHPEIQSEPILDSNPSAASEPFDASNPELHSEPATLSHPGQTSEPPAPLTPREKLRQAVRFFYDLQKLRIQSGNRTGTKEVELDAEDQKFMDKTCSGLEALERLALREVQRHLDDVPIYEEWLMHQRGCGPTMSGVIVSEIDIARAGTVSALWAYAGLAVSTETGKAVKRTRGVKANWNPFLKTKLVHVLAGCLMRARSPWRVHYDNRKHRTTSAGWGVSDGHRHNDATRYMIKMFLADLWRTWRELDGLPVGESYAEAKLGVVHGEHARVAAAR